MNKLEEIQARCEAASPGPWRIGISNLIVDGNGHALFFRDSGKYNAEFIAHAREDIPYLLDEVTRLVARAEALERAMPHDCLTCAHIKSGIRDAHCTACTVAPGLSRTHWQFDEARFAGSRET